jgi:hypothetical protein
MLNSKTPAIQPFLFLQYGIFNNYPAPPTPQTRTFGCALYVRTQQRTLSAISGFIRAPT